MDQSEPMMFSCMALIFATDNDGISPLLLPACRVLAHQMSILSCLWFEMS
jgi:hypothetical protein